MRNHLYDPSVSATANICGQWIDGKRCDQGRLDKVHEVSEPKFFSGYPQVQVRVTSGDLGIHFCQVAWDKQAEGWFAAWYAPHNSPGKWVRANKLDTQKPAGIGTWMIGLLGPNDEEDLIELGLNFD